MAYQRKTRRFVSSVHKPTSNNRLVGVPEEVARAHERLVSKSTPELRTPALHKTK